MADEISTLMSSCQGKIVLLRLRNNKTIQGALIDELNHTLGDQGLEVDDRYIMLVSDLMCSRGYMQQIGRHGIAGTKDSVLARAAFEITVPTIAHAALQGEVEQLRGITENVIVGSQIPIGSGTVDLYMQVSKKK